MLYKVSPSLIDKYLSIRSGLFDKPVDELIAYIKGEGITTPQMSFGTQVHKYFETGESELMVEEKEQLRPFYEIHKPYPKEIRVKIELFPNIIVSTVADEMIGDIVHEFKTGERFWGVDMYENSIQWKMYCALFDSPKVVYHHFQYYKPKPKVPANFNYSSFSFYAYKGMLDEIEAAINDFLSFVKVNELESYILIEQS